MFFLCFLSLLESVLESSRNIKSKERERERERERESDLERNRKRKRRVDRDRSGILVWWRKNQEEKKKHINEIKKGKII